MQQQVELREQEMYLEAAITELEKVNKKLASLKLMQEDLVDKVIGTLGHNHEGQKTYEYRAWKIEVKTPCVYSLDKKLYESGKFELPKKFNPIKKSISYSIDKRLCDQYLDSAPGEVRASLIELIEKRPGRPSVTLKERI